MSRLGDTTLRVHPPEWKAGTESRIAPFRRAPRESESPPVGPLLLGEVAFVVDGLPITVAIIHAGRMCPRGGTKRNDIAGEYLSGAGRLPDKGGWLPMNETTWLRRGGDFLPRAATSQVGRDCYNRNGKSRHLHGPAARWSAGPQVVACGQIQALKTYLQATTRGNSRDRSNRSNATATRSHSGQSQRAGKPLRNPWCRR